MMDKVSCGVPGVGVDNQNIPAPASSQHIAKESVKPSDEKISPKEGFVTIIPLSEREVKLRAKLDEDPILEICENSLPKLADNVHLLSRIPEFKIPSDLGKYSYIDKLLYNYLMDVEAFHHWEMYYEKESERLDRRITDEGDSRAATTYFRFTRDCYYPLNWRSYDPTVWGQFSTVNKDKEGYIAKCYSQIAKVEGAISNSQNVAGNIRQEHLKKKALAVLEGVGTAAREKLKKFEAEWPQEFGSLRELEEFILKKWQPFNRDFLRSVCYDGSMSAWVPGGSDASNSFDEIKAADSEMGKALAEVKRLANLDKSAKFVVKRKGNSTKK